MRCPHCGKEDSKVIDSRPIEENSSIKRRRECLSCQARFTTFETIETVLPMVIKKDGGREFFDKKKVLAGIIKACQKRPVDAEAVVADIEKELTNSLASEITSSEIGEMVMDRLRKLDAVAYVRFASVYREFKDVDTFLDELNKMIRASRAAGKKKAATGSGKK